MHLPMKMNCRLFLVGSLSESTFFNTRMFCSAHPNYEWDTHMHTCTHTRPGIKAGPLSSSARLWVAFLSPRFYLRVPFVGRKEEMITSKGTIDEFTSENPNTLERIQERGQQNGWRTSWGDHSRRLRPQTLETTFGFQICLWYLLAVYLWT